MFGPDGKPINLGAAQVIGGPKSLDDIVPFNDGTIDALAEGALQMLTSGQPMEVPAAIPMGQLIQIAKTLLVLRDRVQELEAAQAERDELEPANADRLDLTGL